MFRWIGGLSGLWSPPVTLTEPETARRVHYGSLAVVFILCCTFILSVDTLLPGAAQLAGLRTGDLAPEDIRAPRSITYVSEVLSARARQQAADGVVPIYAAPDLSVAQQQAELTRASLDYISHVRYDPFGTRAQKLADLSAITAFSITPDIASQILDADDLLWQSIDAEISSMLERVMREPIREMDVEALRSQLPMQVSVRFDVRATAIILAILEDLIRPNQFPNPEATEASRRAAALNTPAETRSFAQGQIIVRAGTRLDEVDFEALQFLGLLQPADTRWQIWARSLLASMLVAVGIGSYILRFHTDLRSQPYTLWLLAGLFLLALLGGQLFTNEGQFYLYPAAALSLLYVSLSQVQLAVAGGLVLSILFGLMTGGSLEAAALVAFGSLLGAVSLRRTERVNTYFVAGLMIAIVNFAVVILFNLDTISAGDLTRLGTLIGYSLVNGLFAAATALAGMYMVTLLFNLPTSLKLVDLSQPSQPLLQRLLREAPGTYQHSLQVANLCEQAATAIGANAQLVRVAALYHDIGKMLNPAFFVENQAEGVNPHDQLNDPYRSAAIIISHVTDGDRLAKQYQLPTRVRDFILEHHGTTLVSFFYRVAYDQAEDPEAVDTEQFRYPGPRPLTRETAILMLADTCESVVRARKPATRQQVAEIVEEMIDLRVRDGQLDDSNLTSRDLKITRGVFIEMLQAVYHPRINYPTLPATARKETTATSDEHSRAGLNGEKEPSTRTGQTPERGASRIPAYYEAPTEAPLPEVPPLPRGGRRTEPVVPAPPPESQAETESPQDDV